MYRQMELFHQECPECQEGIEVTSIFDPRNVLGPVHIIEATESGYHLRRCMRWWPKIAAPPEP